MNKLFFLFLILNLSIPDEARYNSHHKNEFKFDVVLDPLLMGTGLIAQLTANYNLKQLSTFKNTPEELYSWDKSWVGTKNDLAVDWSNYLTYPVIGIGLGYSFYEGFGNDNKPYLVQYLTLLTEILTYNSAINLWVRSIGFWPRPRYYHEDGPEKTKGELLGSFYSGHASAAFAVATYYTLAITNRYGIENTWYYSTVLAATATSIAWLRVEGGKHYPSDVIVGAAVGTTISSLFYWWRAKDSKQKSNSKKEKLKVLASPNYLGLAYSF
jgi:membrane-associated phospholipid phosphatase